MCQSEIHLLFNLLKKTSFCGSDFFFNFFHESMYSKHITLFLNSSSNFSRSSSQKSNRSGNFNICYYNGIAIFLPFSHSEIKYFLLNFMYSRRHGQS